MKHTLTLTIFCCTLEFEFNAKDLDIGYYEKYKPSIVPLTLENLALSKYHEAWPSKKEILYDFIL